MPDLDLGLWIDRGGETVTGKVPPSLVVVGGEMSRHTAALVRAAYGRFSAARYNQVSGYASQDWTLADGSRMRATSINGVDQVYVWPAPVEDDQPAPMGWRGLPSRAGGYYQSGWVRHKDTGALLPVPDSDAEITLPGYEGTNPHLFISPAGKAEENSKHAAGDWFWTDHKDGGERLLFTADGVRYRSHAVNLWVGQTQYTGADGAAVAGQWIVLIHGTTVLAVQKHAVVAARGRPVQGVVVGDGLPQSYTLRDSPAGYRRRPKWRFSPDGLRALSLDGAGRVKNPWSSPGKYMRVTGDTIVGDQFVHRITLTATGSDSAPFTMAVTSETLAGQVLKVKPAYELQLREVGRRFEFYGWLAMAYARYAYHFVYDYSTFSRSVSGVLPNRSILPPPYPNMWVMTQEEADAGSEVLSAAAREEEGARHAPTTGVDYLLPSPTMRDYSFSPATTIIWGAVVPAFEAWYLEDGQKKYATDKVAISRQEVVAAGYAAVSGPNGENLKFSIGNFWIAEKDEETGVLNYTRHYSAWGWIGTFRDTYAIAASRRALPDVIDDSLEALSHYESFRDPSRPTLPNEVVAGRLLDRLGSPTTPADLAESAQDWWKQGVTGFFRVPTFVNVLFADGMYQNLGTSEFPAGVSVPSRTVKIESTQEVLLEYGPDYSNPLVVDYTAATTWRYEGRAVVDIDYGEDGRERVLEFVADPSKTIRYDAAIYAAEPGGSRSSLESSSSAQRGISGACRLTLELDGVTVAEHEVSAADAFEGFLRTDYAAGWRGFPSRLTLNQYGTYENDPLMDVGCQGSMACRVDAESFFMLDHDVRFGHVLLAAVKERMRRVTADARGVQASGEYRVVLWDNGLERSLSSPLPTASSQFLGYGWYGAIGMVHDALYSGPARWYHKGLYFSNVSPISGGGQNDWNSWSSFPHEGVLTASEQAVRVALDGLVPANPPPLTYPGTNVVSVQTEVYSPGMYFASAGVAFDYEAALKMAGMGEGGVGWTNGSESGPSITDPRATGRILSLGRDVWMAVVDIEASSAARHSFIALRPAGGDVEVRTIRGMLPFLAPALGSLNNPGALAAPQYVV